MINISSLLFLIFGGRGHLWTFENEESYGLWLGFNGTRDTYERKETVNDRVLSGQRAPTVRYNSKPYPTESLLGTFQKLQKGCGSQVGTVLDSGQGSKGA